MKFLIKIKNRLDFPGFKPTKKETYVSKTVEGESSPNLMNLTGATGEERGSVTVKTGPQRPISSQWAKRINSPNEETPGRTKSPAGRGKQ